MVTTAESKPLTQQEYGRIGARKRWGPQRWLRIPRLDELSPEQRHVLMTLIDAGQKEAGPADNGPASTEVRRVPDAERSAG